MIKIDQEKFEKFVLTATNSEADIFESLQDRIDISTGKLQSKVFGTVLDMQKLPEKMTVEVERFICMDAFADAIPLLDLILTENGFGVVSNQNQSPASRERVDTLRKQIRQSADDALDSIINSLIGHKEWCKSAYATLLVNSLYFTADQLRDYAGKPDAHRSDLLSLRSEISEAEELVMRTISAQFFCYLLSRLRENVLEDYEVLLVWTLRNAVGFFINKQEAAFKRELDTAVNFLENNIEKFPVYKNSEAYKVKHFEYYKNEKEDSCYFFG